MTQRPFLAAPSAFHQGTLGSLLRSPARLQMRTHRSGAADRTLAMKSPLRLQITMVRIIVRRTAKHRAIGTLPPIPTSPPKTQIQIGCQGVPPRPRQCEELLSALESHGVLTRKPSLFARRPLPD